MNIRTFAIGVGVAWIVGGIAWLATSQWRVFESGGYTVRRHTLLGRIEIRRDGKWEAPFDGDLYAPAALPEAIRAAKLERIAWMPGSGLVCAEAVTAPGKPIEGRIALTALVRDAEGKRVRDRTVRLSVRWPAGAHVPFVVDTDLAPPRERQNVRITLEAVH